jgi:hypothetical protein
MGGNQMRDIRVVQQDRTIKLANIHGRFLMLFPGLPKAKTNRKKKQ